jgi:predicted RND superfamily exporter protein
LDLPERVGGFVRDHPLLIVALFGGLFLASLPIFVQMDSYINVYDVSPRTEYYDDYQFLNQEMGWDNLAFVLVTPQESDDLLEADAIREMHAVSQRVEDLEYVRGTLSIATVVELLYNQQPGADGGLPPDNEAGDQTIEQVADQAVRQFGEDALYGRVLARDHEAGAIVVTMPKGEGLKWYRPRQAELLDVGLEVDENNPHQEQTDMRPLSLDMIWLWVEKATTEEGPIWVAGAAVAATLSLGALYRRTPEVLASVATLGIVMTVTIAAGYLVGVRFNVLSMILMALIFGLGVDYCMHVTSRFREERALGHPRDEAVSTAVEHVGAALWMSAVTTTVGFASLYFSLIPAIAKFGIMLGAGILTAFIACVVFLPVLLVAIDSRRDEFPVLEGSEEEVASRRDELREDLRDEQDDAWLARLGFWSEENARAVLLIFLALAGVLAVPYVANGVEIWTGSYTRPHPVLKEETYPMDTLLLAEEEFGIPVDMSVVMYGDAAKPGNIEMVQDLAARMEGVHGSFYTETILFPLDYYLNYTEQGRQCNCDQDGDGIPDTRNELVRAYDHLRQETPLRLAVERVLTDDHETTAVRLSINPQGTTRDLGTDVANMREARQETEQIVADYKEENPEATGEFQFETTGLAVLGVETVDAIKRGNAASIGIMLFVVFSIITYFWRRPLLTITTMVPVFLAILTQYSVTAAMGYQVTYVSLIVTGGATGIGIDDGIHFIARVREEISQGRTVTRAVGLANGEIGAVLAGTTFTDIGGFFFVMFSTISWGAQTAIIVIPTLGAAWIATVGLLPALVKYHARWRPRDYLMRDHDDEALHPSLR